MKEKGKEKEGKRREEGKWVWNSNSLGKTAIWLMFIHIPPSTLTEIAGSGWSGGSSILPAPPPFPFPPRPPPALAGGFFLAGA